MYRLSSKLLEMRIAERFRRKRRGVSLVRSRRRDTDDRSALVFRFGYSKLGSTWLTKPNVVFSYAVLTNPSMTYPEPPASEATDDPTTEDDPVSLEDSIETTDENGAPGEFRARKPGVQASSLCME